MSNFALLIDDEKEDDEVLQDARKVNQLVAQFGAAVKQCEASTKAKLDLANAYVREFDDKRIQAEKTANQFRLAAEGVRGILQKMTDEEEERKLLEEMRIPEDNVEDIRRLETREKFIAQTIDVVFPNLTDQEREECNKIVNNIIHHSFDTWSCSQILTLLFLSSFFSPIWKEGATLGSI